MDKLAELTNFPAYALLTCRQQIKPRLPHELVFKDGKTLVSDSEKAWVPRFPVTLPYDFWWATTGKPLARMLEWASYPLPSRSSYLSFYCRYILPEFGPFIPVSKDSSTSPSTLAVPSESKYFSSYMTDDHTPVEFSCVFDDEGTPTIRFSVDPVQRQESYDSPAMAFFEDLANTMPLLSPLDLTWCRICAEELTIIRRGHKGSSSIEPCYPSQYFAGIELSRSSTTLKAYFLPETSALITGMSKIDLITGAVKRICRDSSLLSTPNLQQSWDMLLRFFRSLSPDVTPSVEIVAVDCVPSAKNRMKVYVRTPFTTLATIRRFMTIDSTIESPAINKAIKQVSYLWETLFPGIPDDQEPGVDEDRLRHPTSGLLFYYELRADITYPLPKVYVPVRHLCNSDEEIIDGMEKLYRKTDNLEAMRKYRGLLRNTFDHRSLSARTGVHTYITFAAKSSNAEITTYFNPECFERE